MQSSKVVDAKIKESKAAKRLFKKVNSMIQKMDEVVVKLENKEKNIKNTLSGKDKAEEQLALLSKLYLHFFQLMLLIRFFFLAMN